MARRYLRSDMSEQEARFFTCGCGLFGEENHLTGLFKLVGKFNELNELGRKEEIVDYFPERDRRFKFENRGYTDMGKILKRKYANWHFSRKCLKNLSRKWCFTPVVISFNSDCIISELITYIRQDADLKMACEKYMARFGSGWQELMPIQFDFISTRHTDEHKNYRIAGRIINELASIRL